MSVCPKCGAHNRAEARFCRQCRGPLTTSATSTCPHCGAVLRLSAHFCKHCGKAVVTASTAPIPPEEGEASDVLETGVTCPGCGVLNRLGARFCRVCRHALETSAVLPSTPSVSQHYGTGELQPLTLLADRYVILEKVAQGGMGAIYKALDKRLQDRVVALKEMSELAIVESERDQVLEAFRREAELLARLSHPNMVRVTDRFQQGERHYMVMEYIEGRTLDGLLQGRAEPFPEDLVISWAAQLCDVLAYLHRQTPKIIYRDMKPANVMVAEGTNEVKLIDFGIARFYKPGQKKDTIEFGTSGYAPPEQYGKAQTDERSDIYSLAAMLHELLTLCNPASTLFKFPPIHELNPKVGRKASDAIARALQPRPEKRYQSAEEFRAALPEVTFVGQMAPEMAAPARQMGAPSQQAALPALAIDPQKPATPLDLGQVVAGNGVWMFPIEFSLPQGEKAQFKSALPWLRVTPETVDVANRQVNLEVDTGHLQTGRLHLQGRGVKRWVGWHTARLIPAQQEMQTALDVLFDSGQRQRIPVSVTIVPHAWQVRAGWGLTIGAMMLEASAIVGTLLALVIVGM